MNIEIAKEKLKGIDIKFFLNGMTEQSNYIVDKADEINIAIETVLSELEKKDKEIEQLKSMELKAKYGIASITLEGLINLENELEKRDKIIELMAEELENLKIAYLKKEDGGEFFGQYRTYNKNDWKQYFEKKVEGK